MTRRLPSRPRPDLPTDRQEKARLRAALRLALAVLARRRARRAPPSG